MIKGNLITVVVALALAAATYKFASVFPPIVDDAPGPGFVPKLLAGCMAVLAVALLVQTLVMMRTAKKRAAVGAGPGVTVPEEEGPNFTSPAAMLAYTLAGISIVYAVVIWLAGFMIASLLFIPFAMWVMGERKVHWMVILAVCTVLAYYLVFARFFSMPLPTGILFE